MYKASIAAVIANNTNTDKASTKTDNDSNGEQRIDM